MVPGMLYSRFRPGLNHLAFRVDGDRLAGRAGRRGARPRLGADVDRRRAPDRGWRRRRLPRGPRRLRGRAGVARPSSPRASRRSATSAGKPPVAIGLQRSMVMRMSDLSCSCIAARYSSQSGCSPEMPRKYSTRPSSASGMSSTSADPSTCTYSPLQSSDCTTIETRGSTARVVRLGPVGVGRHDDAAVGVDAARDRRELRAAVATRGREQPAVTRAEELEQLGAVDGAGGGDGRAHGAVLVWRSPVACLADCPHDTTYALRLHRRGPRAARGVRARRRRHPDGGVQPHLQGVLVGRGRRPARRRALHRAQRAPRAHVGDALGGGGGRARTGVRVGRRAARSRGGATRSPRSTAAPRWSSRGSSCPRRTRSTRSATATTRPPQMPTATRRR